MKQHLSVVWTDHSWDVPIRKRPGGGCTLDREILRLVRSRFEPLPMPADIYRPVSLKSSRPRQGGFTIVELLVVIAIIAILAGIILPVLVTVKTRGKVAYTRSEMMNLSAAIKAYEGEYNRYPASQQIEALAAKSGGDYTYGGHWTGAAGDPTNSQVMVILMDIDHAPNANLQRNPRKIPFFNARQSNSDIGFSTVDYTFRDPWGQPYIITLDMNDDNKVVDAVYGEPSVAERVAGDKVGHVGLTRNAANKFELNGPVMIWSFGPDKSFLSTVKANEGVNRDNILSWSN